MPQQFSFRVRPNIQNDRNPEMFAPLGNQLVRPPNIGFPLGYEGHLQQTQCGNGSVGYNQNCWGNTNGQPWGFPTNRPPFPPLSRMPPKDSEMARFNFPGNLTQNGGEKQNFNTGRPHDMFPPRPPSPFVPGFSQNNMNMPIPNGNFFRFPPPPVPIPWTGGFNTNGNEPRYHVQVNQWRDGGDVCNNKIRPYSAIVQQNGFHQHSAARPTYVQRVTHSSQNTRSFSNVKEIICVDMTNKLSDKPEKAQEKVPQEVNYNSEYNVPQRANSEQTAETRSRSESKEDDIDLIISQSLDELHLNGEEHQNELFVPFKIPFEPSSPTDEGFESNDGRDVVIDSVECESGDDKAVFDVEEEITDQTESEHDAAEDANSMKEESAGNIQEGEETSEEPKKFSKSYWRKQRRLRLKERLLAEKLMNEKGADNTDENDDAESSKSARATKSKEIDYDNYLPAHVLMHLKRDLVSVLMEYGQTREVKVSFKDMERSGPHHASRFHTAAVVDNEEFPVGSGSSKKNAKKAAAAQALKIMYERGKRNLEVVNEMAHKKLRAMSAEEVGSHAHRVVLVCRHVLDTVEETQFINYSKDKIASAFVLEYHGKMRVVGMGTGNRCILFQHMTSDGKRVIHAHAEIIARRAFIRYLYKQLLNYSGNRSHPILTKSDTGKLKLRDKIQVHLYISRPPCGDAAAFPTISNFPNKMRAIRKQGQLRTIIDDGEGAIPTDFPLPPGANGKERLRIMTCSDKICRWNVLGVQGALLSHYLDPIYISSLVIGSHTGDQRGHVPRAVSGRLKCGRLHEVVQRPYRINTPDIHYPHDDLADTYNITKSKQYCITWSYGDRDAEVIDAITGVTNMEAKDEVIASRVSKTSVHDLFKEVCQKYGRQELANLPYLKAKRSASTFQRMKCFVGQHLAAMGFGQWFSLQDTYGTDNLQCPDGC